MKINFKNINTVIMCFMIIMIILLPNMISSDLSYRMYNDNFNLVLLIVLVSLVCYLDEKIAIMLALLILITIVKNKDVENFQVSDEDETILEVNEEGNYQFNYNEDTQYNADGMPIRSGPAHSRLHTHTHTHNNLDIPNTTAPPLHEPPGPGENDFNKNQGKQGNNENQGSEEESNENKVSSPVLQIYDQESNSGRFNIIAQPKTRRYTNFTFDNIPNTNQEVSQEGFLNFKTKESFFRDKVPVAQREGFQNYELPCQQLPNSNNSMDITGCRYDYKNSPLNATINGPPLSSITPSKYNGSTVYPLNG